MTDSDNLYNVPDMKIQLKNPKITNSIHASSFKQFLLTLLATTVSIVLTFGTSAIIEKHQKNAAKKEMVMMIIYDFDKTIEKVQCADSAFRLASKTEQEIALHPDYFDSLRARLHPAMMLVATEFSETTEKIFSSNIETFNTLGNVNFVHEVSSFYNARRLYQDIVLDLFKQEVSESANLQSVERLFNIDFPGYYFTNKQCLIGMLDIRNRCMQMMDVSEEELQEFSQQRMLMDDKSKGTNTLEPMLEEMFEAEAIIGQAKENLGQSK